MNLNLRKILVPIDFSETGMLALEHASFMARLAKADLLLLHVLPVQEYHFEIPEPVMRIDNHDEVNQIVEQKLNETIDRVRMNYGCVAKSLSSRGKVAHEIMEIANEQKVDLIVMGTHGASGFEEFFLGSNAHKVVTVAPCPVITVQTHSKKLGFSNIVLPIDRTLHSREKVEIAVTMANLFAAKIHIVGLLEELDSHEEDKLNIVLDQVQKAIEKHELPFTRKIVKGSNLASEALKYGAGVNADLIVIMTEHESAMNGIFLGNRAKQIVNHSKIPVMSIKPSNGKFDRLDMGGSYTF
jgi:nucleotide-binding universal stress UspA family protein